MVSTSWTVPNRCRYHKIEPTEGVRTRGHELKLQKRACRMQNVNTSECSWTTHCELLETLFKRRHLCSRSVYRPLGLRMTEEEEEDDDDDDDDLVNDPF